MTRTTCSLIAVLIIAAASAHAETGGRAMMGPPPPIESSYLTVVPTAHVTKSLDLDLSGVGVFLGEETSLSRGAIRLGVGDIAEVEVSTMSMLSSLEKEDKLSNIPGGGLKVAFPVWRNIRGVAVSFRRSGTNEESVGGEKYEEKVGEFSVVTSAANFATDAEGAAATGGWLGTKVKGHLGVTYLDARLDNSGPAVKKGFLRPFGGVEIWRGGTQVPHTRVMAEVGWMPHFTADGAKKIITDEWVAVGGIRFFYHRYGSFDIGVRYQSNYEGLSESTLQAQLRLGWPTHLIRERIIGM